MKAPTPSPLPTKILDVRHLRVHFKTDEGMVEVVRDVSFTLFRRETLALVGESGSGKSVTCLSINRLLPCPPAVISGGEIIYQEVNLLRLPWKEMHLCRGKDIAMIFQEPATALNPILTIRTQMNEVWLRHKDIRGKEADYWSIDLLARVGLPDAAKRLDSYPHELSGGMRQRVLIAMALITNPSILIADEPTTALDVTTQAQILELLVKMQQERKIGSLIFITHNLALVSQIADRVIVFYAGQIQEEAPASELFRHPAHPYTQGLLSCFNSLEHKEDRFHAISGNPPDLKLLPSGCPFHPRCPHVVERCKTVAPELRAVNEKHTARCHFV
ncbi:MAG: ABC transporter ATP-binding protein [Candidatus Aureabacteria bacterium]|nr:ABC transporter ATP-binding protein [Candidatus Auribacterota bacterium]